MLKQKQIKYKMCFHVGPYIVFIFLFLFVFFNPSWPTRGTDHSLSRQNDAYNHDRSIVTMTYQTSLLVAGHDTLSKIYT